MNTATKVHQVCKGLYGGKCRCEGQTRLDHEEYCELIPALLPNFKNYSVERLVSNELARVEFNRKHIE